MERGVDAGFICALIDTLIEHWGAVQHDLLAVGLHWHDLGTERMSLGELAAFVAYATPTSALGFLRTEGWTPATHLSALIYDDVELLLWLKTEDALLDVGQQQHKPKPTPRPGVTVIAADPLAATGMDVELYLQRVAESRELARQRKEARENGG